MNYKRTHFWVLGVLCAFLIGIPYRGYAETRPTTLTVMPFTASQGQSQAWLSKGLADLFTKDLGQVNSFVLLERSRMQAFVNELELSQSGLIDQSQALRMGRVARVEQVLYGNYALSGKDVRINVFLLETDSQEIIQTAKASGKLKQIRELVQQVSLDLIKNRGVKLSREESRKIRFIATDSIQATEHFYTGMDLFDHGQYPDAFGRFFAASKNDPNYWEAHLWMGRLLEAQAQVRESVLTYKKLFKKAPAIVESQDAMMFAGLAVENRLQDPDQAIEIYKSLSVKKPQTPHNIEALFRLGGLLAGKKRYKEAYQAFQEVVDFHKKYSKGLRQRAGIRNSSYFGWRHASTLHWDTVRQMIVLYPDLTEALPRKQWPPLPAGAYLMDPKNPVIKSRMKNMPTFFKDVRRNQEWEEYYYAIVIPNGYEFTGVEMEATGKVFRRGTSGGQSGDDFRIRVHPFPLARDIHSSWLGALYGQTLETTTLRKGVTFHGENRKIIVVEVGAAKARIDGWEIKGHIQKVGRKAQASPITPQIGKNPEALHLNTIPFLSGQFSGSNRENHFYIPKKELAMAMDQSGRIGLVTLSGALDDAESDLWFSQSKDGKTWKTPFRLPINSSSQEYNPRLVPAEDGSLQLFWISKRRGQGWELWTSKLSKKDKWSHPSRVPLETIEPWKPTPVHMARKTKSSAKGLIKSLFSNESNNRSSKFEEFSRVGIPRFLEYSVTQNRRGQWVLAYYSYVANGVVILQSTNLQDWKKVSEIDTEGPVFGPSLIQDSKGVYRLALFANGRTRVYSSNQGRRWSKKEYSLKCYCDQYSNEVHSLQLIPKPDGRLTLLLSDNFYGLQYANFDPDANQPQLDLVSRVRTEPYAITPFKDGKYLVALKKDRGVGIYQYKNFTTSSENSGNGIIYTETALDPAGNRWDRIFAHRRFISSDVTSLAIGPKGRIWWGIESGLMTLNGEVFALQDVSNGFFHNFITDIAPCSDSHAWVSSSFHEHPEVGRVSVNPKEYRSFRPLKTTRVRIPDAHGAISVIKCADGNKGLLVGTTEGQFIKYKNNRVVLKHQFASAVTAIAENDYGKYSIGTGDGEIYFFQNKISIKAKSFKGRVNDLVIDAQGDLWAAVEGEGLSRYQKGKWKTFSTKTSKVAYDRIGTLTPDKNRGVWYVAHGEMRSFGVGFFDGKEHGLYNPPQRLIDKPSSLEVGPKGRIWLGTWFNGVYQLVKNKP
jgi:tetratricopeptide (TPR) repeat protein